MKRNLKAIGIITLLIGVVIFLIYSYVNKGSDELIKNNSEDIYEETQEVIETEQNTKQIVVEIKGEIKNPNVYWVNEDSIVDELISKAGGLTDNADISSVNRAEKLKDHELVIIPDKNSAQKDNSNVKILGNGKDNSSSKLININTADENELDSLPGIGPSRAKDIIRYREENGGFQNIEDIKKIKGIGESSFEKLKDKITV